VVSVGITNNNAERQFVILVAAVHRTAMAIEVNRRYLSEIRNPNDESQNKFELLKAQNSKDRARLNI
jgi:hypothetical protein